MNGQEKQKPELGKVRDVEQQLYSKNKKLKEYQRFGFHENSDESSIKTDWNKPVENAPEENKTPKKKKRKPMTGFAKLLIASVLFFVFSLFAAFMVFFLNTNEVQYDAIQLSVLGPNSIAGGEELQFDISVINNNPIDVVLSDIIVNYPAGTITADNEGLPLQKDITSIEEIRSGLSQTKKFKAVLFGSEGDQKDITIVFQYRVPGSDNIFFKERVYQVGLDSAPVVLSVENEENFQSGDDVEVELKVTSNAKSALRNLFLSIDYPFGFEFASSAPVGIDQSSYFIGDLESGEEKIIMIRGTIQGQDGEQRTIRYSLGSEDARRPGNLGTVFTLAESVLAITKPPINLALEANGLTQSIYIAQPGERIDMVLDYQNGLLTKIIDTGLVVALSGTGYDIRQIDADAGYYRSADQTISWDQTNFNLLNETEPGTGSSVGFDVSMLGTAAMAGFVENPELTVNAQAQATNFELGGEEKTVSGETVTRIKIETVPTIDAYLLYADGPFENTGPVTPQVGEITTYTLALEVGNSTNEIKNTAVTFTLPRYIQLQELLSPGDADIEYDERNRQVTWNVGTVAPGTGYTQSTNTAYVSLAFEPSLDQVRDVPVVVENITVEAIDSFTQTAVSADQSALDTSLRRDDEHRNTSTRVVE